MFGWKIRDSTNQKIIKLNLLLLIKEELNTHLILKIQELTNQNIRKFQQYNKNTSSHEFESTNINFLK